MINPVDISEQLLFSTTRICTNNSCGTGFFFKLLVEGKNYPLIVTNKHVVENKVDTETRFCFHVKEDNKPGDSNICLTLQTHWYFHPYKDLCFCFLMPIINEIKVRYGKEIYFIFFEERLIPDQKALDQLTALESVVMVGYPNGLWDEVHNFPLFRTGFTASHPAIDFNIDGDRVVDMACFPGSSGSPILIYNQAGYSDKQGNVVINDRVIFLGILHSGPFLKAQGDVMVVNTTNQRVISNTNVMINLGYYIKSAEILAFKETIKIMCFSKNP